MYILDRGTARPAIVKMSICRLVDLGTLSLQVTILWNVTAEIPKYFHSYVKASDI